jgi:hypothetical protein
MHVTPMHTEVRRLRSANQKLSAALIRLLKDNDQDAVDGAYTALGMVSQLRGHEPGGKNHSTDSSGVGDCPMKAELNGELPQEADGDGCLGQVKDQPANILTESVNGKG